MTTRPTFTAQFLAAQSEPILDGDFPGHPFRGNAAVKVPRATGAAVDASKRAKHAEKHGDAEKQKTAHQSAHYSHKAAALHAKGTTKKYHETMAKFHAQRGGILDAAVLDDASGESFETVVGTISKDGAVMGRAAVSTGDGKAMIYLGATGTDRVTSADGQPARWSDDDAVLMVDWLADNAAAMNAPAQEPTAEPTQGPAVVPTTIADGRAALAEIADWMPVSQRKAIESAMRGEEGLFFAEKMVEMARLIATMPKTYEQDGMGGKAVAHLHYFKGGGDWYITERDQEEEQHQAYGVADLGHGPEMGYISIVELVSAGVELDLYWNPKTVGELRGESEEPAATSDDDQDANIGRMWRAPEGFKEITGIGKDGRYTVQIIDNDRERRPGLPIDADELEQQVRDDERAVEEEESAARAAGGAGTVPAMTKTPDTTPAAQPGPGMTFLPAERAQWEMDVADQIAEQGGMSTGDAQGVMEANAAAVDKTWAAKMGPAAAAGVLLGDPMPVDVNAQVVADPAALPAPAGNPQKDADAAYLQTLIDGSADFMDEGILGRLEPMFETYASDPDMMDLLNRAADAYGAAAMAAAQQALKG